MTYVGDFQYGDFHGHGMTTYNNGETYVGEYYRGYFQGQGCRNRV